MHSNKKVAKIDELIKKDVYILSEFISIYCNENHNDRIVSSIKSNGILGEYLNDNVLKVCTECKKLLLYSASKRIICPYNPKPQCKKCITHCYTEEYQKSIKEVMKFSGIFLIKKGKLGLIKKYFF